MFLKKAEIEKRTTELLMPILEEFGLELWDVEYAKEGKDFYLKIYIFRNGPIDISDCVKVSRAIDPILDEENFISDAYTLEVSSPGLTRPLKRENDFLHSIGRLVELKTYKAIDGAKEFEGILKGYDEESIVVTINDNDTRFKREDVAGIKRAFVEEDEEN